MSAETGYEPPVQAEYHDAVAVLVEQASMAQADHQQLVHQYRDQLMQAEAKKFTVAKKRREFEQMVAAIKALGGEFDHTLDEEPWTT